MLKAEAAGLAVVAGAEVAWPRWCSMTAPGPHAATRWRGFRPGGRSAARRSREAAGHGRDGLAVVGGAPFPAQAAGALDDALQAAQAIRMRAMIVLIRHGRTAWNEPGACRSHDVPLSAAGRDQVRGWRLPRLGPCEMAERPAAPRDRDRALLTAQPVAIEARLIEMDSGSWKAAPWKAWGRGTGHGGERGPWPGFPAGEREGPREVRARFTSLLADLCDDMVCVTHEA